MRSLKGNSLRTVLLVILVVAVFAPSLVHAKDYTVGVKAGDWVKYGQTTFNWTGNGTEPSYATEFKKIDWTRLDIINVTGTTASLNVTIHFNNGTQTVQSYDADVQNGSSIGDTFLVGSNLIAGDPLSPATPGTTINQTMIRIYAGANRNVNVIDLKTNYTVAGEYRGYWDKAQAFWWKHTLTKQTPTIQTHTLRSRSKQQKRTCGQQMLSTSYRTIFSTSLQASPS